MTDMPKFDRAKLGQIVLVLQGGGALGAYQVGVYQALCEAGIEPDWVIGTSIGAINASLIAGSPPGQRLPRLEEFWRRVTHPPLSQLTAMAPCFGQWTANVMTIAGGLSDFFKPNPLALLGLVPARPGTLRLLFDGAARTHARGADRSGPVEQRAARASLSAPRRCKPARCIISTAASAN